MMRCFAILFLAFSLQAQPKLEIVVGNEGYPGLPGLIGTPPNIGQLESMTILELDGTTRLFLFNLQVVNKGDQPFDPKSIRPDIVVDDWWAGSISIRGFWRFELFDSSSNVVSRSMVPAANMGWDYVALSENSPPMRFDYDHPGLSPDRAAIVLDPFFGRSFLILGQKVKGPHTLRVTMDWFNVLRQKKSVEVHFLIDLTDITFLPQ